ncbi:MAG: polyprenyl synthetase family protein [Bacteroidales bacterium]|nr:polyprenyl synthetase family protein [Bacteroidales bacterium]
MDIKSIRKDIEKEWSLFEEMLRSTLMSSSGLLNSINSYLMESTGKQIRPLLSLLASKACGTPNNLTISCAVVSEMIHTATLLHDDVADDSIYRRGKETVQSRFNPAASVLTGDYWLARALTLIVNERDMSVMGYFTKAVQELSEGELFQMQKATTLDTTEADYYKIIAQKTSSLFIAAVQSAVSTMDTDERVLENMGRYAYHLGLAFQIKDDIFDYTPKLNTGKPAGGDIMEKKLTLPLIVALNRASIDEREKMLEAVKSAGPDDFELVTKAFALVEKYSGKQIAQEALDEQCKKALECLEVLPDNLYKRHLITLTKYMGSRES